MNDPGSPLLQRSWSVRHGANTRGGEKGWTQPSHISAAGEAAEILTVYLDDVPQWLQNIHTVLNVNKNSFSYLFLYLLKRKSYGLEHCCTIFI
jgi:hypothetical protein